MIPKLKVEHTKREVIEERLLMEITEKEKVAIILSKDELDFLIRVMSGYAAQESYLGRGFERSISFRTDLCKLRRQAFPTL